MVIISFSSVAAGEPQTTPASGTVLNEKWIPPRSADGHPSVEGVWENNSATPLERPRQFADKPFLTDDELSSLERKR
jgi:hypothetical protein